jgi:hypothetical protein
MSRMHFKVAILAILSTTILFGDGLVRATAPSCANPCHGTEADFPLRPCNEEGFGQLHGRMANNLSPAILKRSQVRQRWVSSGQCIAKNAVSAVKGPNPSRSGMSIQGLVAVSAQAPMRSVVLLI